MIDQLILESYVRVFVTQLLLLLLSAVVYGFIDKHYHFPRWMGRFRLVIGYQVLALVVVAVAWALVLLWRA